MATYSNTYPKSYGNVTYTLSTPATSGSVVTIGGTGAGNWTTAASPYVYTNGSSSSSAIKIQGDAEIAGDLKVRGVNISEILAKIQDRLAILVPDPERLEKYQALKQAYEHYKTLEALCVEEDKPTETR
jgi:hypothetical protein